MSTQPTVVEPRILTVLLDDGPSRRDAVRSLNDFLLRFGEELATTTRLMTDMERASHFADRFGIEGVRIASLLARGV